MTLIRKSGINKSKKLPAVRKFHVLVPTSGFSAIPNVLLRTDECPFESPAEFMAYMILFSRAYGFGRNICDMAQGRLVKLTKLSKNSVKKSLESLQRQGWIKMITDFETGHVSRQWRVYQPGEKMGGEMTYIFQDENGSKSDTVKSRPSQKRTYSGSNSDIETGSKFDPIINNKIKKIKKAEVQDFQSSEEEKKQTEEWEKVLSEFERRYPKKTDQDQVILKACVGSPFEGSVGELARAWGIRRWSLGIRYFNQQIVWRE